MDFIKEFIDKTGIAGIIFIIVLLYSFLSVITMRKKKPEKEKNPENEERELSCECVIDETPSNTEYIIDITPTEKNEPEKIIHETFKVPLWEHHYVYSHEEILRATPLQRKFYYWFKKRFLNGEYVDLEGNTNYSFILLFDLLNNYKPSTNIQILQKHLKTLSKYYPKTEQYANRELIRLFEKLGMNDEADRIRGEQYNYWKLGSRHKEKLKLNHEEIKILNSIYYPPNKFNKIDFCMSETIKLYCAVIKKLRQICSSENTAFDKEINSISILIAGEKHQNNSALKSITNELHTFILKHCENEIREYFEYNTKLNVTLTNERDTKIAYNSKIISQAIELIPSLINNISPLDSEKEKILNNEIQSRWKTKMKKLKENYKTCSKTFFNDTIQLSELNEKSQEEICYTATKFVLKQDSKTALKLYFHYVFYVIRNHNITTEKILQTLNFYGSIENETDEFKNKDQVLTQINSLNTEILKLFKKEEHIYNFKAILENFISERDLNQALINIPEIYRRKIHINTHSISKIRKQHETSVEILNKYLSDESTSENNNVDENLHIKETETENTSTLSPVQLITLSFFAENNFNVLNCDMETFSRSKGLFTNNLIGGINELCFEKLNENILIEQEDEHYTIKPDYYKTIITA